MDVLETFWSENRRGLVLSTMKLTDLALLKLIFLFHVRLAYNIAWGLLKSPASSQSVSGMCLDRNCSVSVLDRVYSLIISMLSLWMVHEIETILSPCPVMRWGLVFGLLR